MGLFLGLCIWKFGDPVILDHKIDTPSTLTDFLSDAWPPHWANWIFAPLAALGALIVLKGSGGRWPALCLWLLPLTWLVWQFISAAHSVDADLSNATLWQYSGCVACYFLGVLLFRREQLVRWLLIGLLVAFAFCLVRAVNQRLFEYPQNVQMLTEGERTGWTNFPPESIVEMKRDGIVITTNGVDLANPVILDKFAGNRVSGMLVYSNLTLASIVRSFFAGGRVSGTLVYPNALSPASIVLSFFAGGRVSGTLVYPNALAELILLSWPVALVLAFGSTGQLRPNIRRVAIALTILLGAAAFFWTGSKLGWLIGMFLAGVVLFRRNWSKKLKFAAVAAVLVLGLGVFAVRFHHYFAAGATSAGARFDYWRAAVQTTANRPWFGTGPGTFQRPYAALKAPESEMARLAHNDYLEQFSDSGIPGGLAYTAWIVLAMTALGRKLWSSSDHFSFAIFLGLLGWFIQGLGEFGLFVPALAWTAFTLMGSLAGRYNGQNGQE